MGRKFLLKTYNMSLKYLFEQSDLNARKARWLSFLSEYHFELKHIKGKEIKAADDLSQQTHMIYEMTLSQNNTDLHERIRTANIVVPLYVEVLKKVQEDRLFQQQKEYKVEEMGLRREILRSRRRGHSVQHPHRISLGTLVEASRISKDDI